MSGYSVSTAVGRVVTGESDSIWSPRTPRPGRCGVVLVHGLGAPQHFIDSTQPNATLIPAVLASNGMPCIAGAFGGDSWGNTAGVSAVTAAWTTLKAAYPLMRTDKMILIGVSHGGTVVTRYAQANPTKVAAVVGILPAYDPKYLYQNVSGFVTTMETAWSFTGLANFPTNLDLASHAASAVGIPVLTGYSSSDTTVPQASVLPYNTAVGGTAVNLGTNGHSDASVGALPLTTIAQFLATNGA